MQAINRHIIRIRERTGNIYWLFSYTTQFSVISSLSNTNKNQYIIRIRERTQNVYSAFSRPLRICVTDSPSNTSKEQVHNQNKKERRREREQAIFIDLFLTQHNFMWLVVFQMQATSRYIIRIRERENIECPFAFFSLSENLRHWHPFKYNKRTGI